MKGPPSLTRRLIVTSLLIQLLGSFVAWSLALLLELAGLVGNFDVELSDYAYNHVRKLVIESLVREPSGRLRIEPTLALRARADRSPQLQFAVFKTLEEPAFPGSSEALAVFVHNPKAMKIRGERFSIRDARGIELRGFVAGGNTPYGPLYVAASGYAFTWTDWFYAFGDDAGFIGVFICFVGSASAAVTWFNVRSALAPLRRVAAAAKRIDLASLGQGIDPGGVPSEIRPVIDATNDALARLDAGVVRMRRYTANAAHELRTPLAILRARLQNPEESSFKTDLEQDANQLQAIVEQLLIAARLGENQVSVREKADLVETVWGVVAARAPLAIKSKRRIEFEVGGAPDCVRGNRRAIESIAANLVDNALRAEPEEGVVLVRVEGATLEVIDHGEGIAESDRRLIFEPFWRKSEATSGSGLGLAITAELVAKHGGDISVLETPGGGATFKVSFERP